MTTFVTRSSRPDFSTRQWAAKLEAAGVRTAFDLKRANPAWVGRHLNVVGQRIVCELNGESCLPLELVAPPKKGITVSRSFGRDIPDLAGVREALAHFVTRAGEQLRHEGLAAGHLSVFLHTNPFAADKRFYSNSAGLHFSTPTDFTPDLLTAAMRPLDRVYRVGLSYKKCGVMLTGLCPPVAGKADLFDDRDRRRERRLMTAMDAINGRFGAGTVFFASAGVNPRWTARAAMRSGRYTTCWGEVPVVRC